MDKYIVMIDIETLGVNSNAPILSIGVVDSTGHCFYRNLDVQAQIEAGAKPDWSTIFWWMRQSDAARGSLSEFGTNTTESLFAMTQEFRWEDAEIWCNGASFDFPILESAFARHGIKTPWKYFQCRDFRTFHKLYAGAISKHAPNIAHNALSDAEAQMATLVELLNEHQARNLISQQYRKEAASRHIPDEKQQSICGGHCG